MPENNVSPSHISIGEVFPGDVFKAVFWKRSSSGGLQHALMSATGLAEG